jgi:hypothetical protein
LIADEVGLGKTVEVGLLIQKLLATNPRLQVLYLGAGATCPKCAKRARPPATAVSAMGCH